MHYVPAGDGERYRCLGDLVRRSLHRVEAEGGQVGAEALGDPSGDGGLPGGEGRVGGAALQGLEAGETGARGANRSRSGSTVSSATARTSSGSPASMTWAPVSPVAAMADSNSTSRARRSAYDGRGMTAVTRSIAACSTRCPVSRPSA